MDVIGKTPLEVFYYWEHATPENVFLRQPINGIWKTWTFKQAASEIRKIATFIKSQNLPTQSNIAILSKNCAHWIMADLAIWMSGHVSVPIYPTFSASIIRQILEHSNSKILFVGKLDNFDDQKEGIPFNVKCVSFGTYGQKTGSLWEDVIETTHPMIDPPYRKPEEIATIKYTSGTTGSPKGVMITFQAFHYVTPGALKRFNLEPKGQRFFSYLPLSHIAERMLIECGGIYLGATISFSESLEKFPENLMETKPTVFLAVPRIWSKFREKIEMKMPKLDRLLSIPVVSSIVKNAIRRKLGLSKAQWILTGAAPMSVDLLQWFQKIGITIHEVYGMTENLAYSHINLNEVRFGTVGKKWDNVEVKLSPEGEILTRHAGMMSGYYRDQALTDSVFTQDGFLKTGDKGELDKDGFLTITGRIKDQFKTDKAKYVDPAPIELKLSSNPDIEQVCVVGMGIPQPIALTVLSASAKAKARDALKESLKRTLEIVNQSLESFEHVKAAVIMRDDWTVENGLMTPSLKIKRNELEKLHLQKYPKWYQEDDVVVWE
jgi:long-chain acyl-CoA synthetase